VNQVNSIASVNKKQTKNDNNDNYIENVKIISQNYAKIKKMGSEPNKKTQTGSTGSELKIVDSRNPVKNKPRRELEYIIQSSKENEGDTGSEPSAAGDEIAADNTPVAEKVKSIAFVWPIEGRISSGFGVRRDPFSKSKKIQTQFHSGIDISTNEGTPIKASESGIVVFSGWKDGYGNLVMIRHKLGYFTVYAHNSKNLCSVNDYVEQNDIIAHSGSTGNVTGPHLHFEIRKYLTPLNPIRMIR
jgi:murein DD-endopeptidase MepM/ murein hydrolase activator NlpD